MADQKDFDFGEEREPGDEPLPRTPEDFLYNIGKTGLEVLPAVKGARVIQKVFKNIKGPKRLSGKQKQVPEKPFDPIGDYWGSYFPWLLKTGEEVLDYFNPDKFTEEQQKAVSKKKFFPEYQVHLTQKPEHFAKKNTPYSDFSFNTEDLEDPGYKKAIENRDILNNFKKYFNNIEASGAEGFFPTGSKPYEYTKDTQHTLDTIYFKTVNPRIDGRRELRQLIMKAIRRLTPNTASTTGLVPLRFKRHGQQDVRTLYPHNSGPLNKVQFLAQAALQPPTRPELDYKYEGEENTSNIKYWDNTGEALGYLNELLEITNSQEKYEKEMFKYTKDITGRVIPYAMTHKPPTWSKERWDEWKKDGAEPWKIWHKVPADLKRYSREKTESGAIYFASNIQAANQAAQSARFNPDLLRLQREFASRWLRAFPGEKKLREERAKRITRLNPLGRQPTPSDTAVPYELSWDFLADNHRTFKRFLNSALDGENAQWMNLSTQDDIVNFLSQLNFPRYFQDKYDPNDPKIWRWARQEEVDFVNYSPEEIREYFRNPPKPGELEIDSPITVLELKRGPIKKKKELEKYRHITRGLHRMLNEYHSVQAMYNMDKVETMEMWLGGDINGRNPHLPTWINDNKKLPDVITYPQLLDLDHNITTLTKRDIVPLLKEYNNKVSSKEKIHIDSIDFPYLKKVLRMNLNLMYGDLQEVSTKETGEKKEQKGLEMHRFYSPFSPERYRSIMKPNEWWQPEFKKKWIQPKDYTPIKSKADIQTMGKALQNLNKYTATKNTLITREAIRRIAQDIEFSDIRTDIEGALPSWNTFEKKTVTSQGVPKYTEDDKWTANKFARQQTIKFLGFSGSRTTDEAGISTAMVDMNQIKDPKAKTQKFDTSRGAVHRASIPASILALMTGAYLTKKQMDELDRLEKEGQGKPVKRKRKGKRTR